jgi:hypothetical protein
MGALADVTEGFAFRDERYFAERRRQAAGKVAHLDELRTSSPDVVSDAAPHRENRTRRS